MDWFRMYAEFATDPKVQMMPEAMQRRLVMLLCLQCGNGIETFHETERKVPLHLRCVFLRLNWPRQKSCLCARSSSIGLDFAQLG